MKKYNFLNCFLIMLFLISKTTYANIVVFNIKKDSVTLSNPIKNSPAYPLKINSILKSVANIAPEIKATGNQVYCPQSNIKIATDVSITDPDDTGADAMYIQISSGYVSGQDILKLTGSHPTITSSWDIKTGKLKLYSPTGIDILYTDFVNAIKDVVFYNPSPNPSGTRSFSISIGDANYLPSTQHYYEFIPSLAITWTEAKIAAESKTYFGLQGYLATVTSLDEVQITGAQATGSGWIGGSDAAKDDVWRWVTGPENGTIFWNGKTNGSTPNFAYWNTGEPNDYLSTGEKYAHITAPGVGIKGSWNDMTVTGDNTGTLNGAYQAKGYAIEYGGMPGDPIIHISASTTLTIAPQVTITTTPASRCDPGIVTLSATTSAGTVSWYADPEETILLATGTSYSPNISSTTTYYLVSGCAKKTIEAKINPFPEITSTTPASRCGTGFLTLGATASEGTVNWYADAGGTILLETGNNYSPSISSTTTFYVGAINASCNSSLEPVVATINATPEVMTTTPASRCGAGTITLEATALGGTINWYADANGTSLLASGVNYSPSISATTTYYVRAIGASCDSALEPVVATINAIPEITATETASRCEAGVLTLGATASEGTINWYADVNGTSLLATGTNYSPFISVTTTYYVRAIGAICQSGLKPIVATVNTIPKITTTIPASRCGAGTVTLEASSSGGTINWYATEIGGNIEASGNSITLSNVEKSSVYYAEAFNNGCSNGIRVPVAITVYTPPAVVDQEVVLCESSTVILDALLPNMSYLWSTGETTQKITVSALGTYSVDITSPAPENCTSRKKITVLEHAIPEIKYIDVNETTVVVYLTNPEDYFEYSVDGVNYQLSNVFFDAPSGLQTAYVREINFCGNTSQNFVVLVVPKFFTPNNDGFNDYWEVKGMINYPDAEVSIFDRYGKLITKISSSNPFWDGNLNKQPLPATDYWYALKIDNESLVIRGHFSLKR